jgi:uncharacterized membrane protein
MIKKLLISVGLSLIIFEFMNYITYKKQNKVLLNINKNILQSAMMYFSNTEIKESELEKFKDFVLSRISDKKLDNWIINFTVKLIDTDKLSISYGFRRAEEIQNISYEIKKNTHFLKEATISNDKKETDTSEEK